jgi:hypothetical protein
MVNDGVKDNILVPVRVTLRIHRLSNQVCIEYGLITIVECEHVLTCVEDGVGVGQSKGVTVFIPFPGSEAALHQSSPLGDRNLCIEVVVPHLWGHLKVTVVKVKVMVVIIEVIVRGQVFCRKVLFRGIESKVVSNSLIEYPAHFQVNRAVDLFVRQMLQGSSEVQNKMIIMGHQILSCHVPVVRSFFIL